MKRHCPFTNRTFTRLAVLLPVLLLHGYIRAQTFTYTNCDLLAGFRLKGGADDLVVNLGPVGYYENLPARSVITVTNLSATQLNIAFPSWNGISWSLCAAMRGNPAYAQYALHTLWISSPRLNINTPGPVWQRASAGTLAGSASQINAIGVNAALYGNGHAAGGDNSPAGIIIPSASAFSYTFQVGVLGNLGGTFQGNPENTTPEDFDTAGFPSRSVLYRLEPDAYPHAAGTLIGFFDFKPDGTLMFTAGPPPEQVQISRVNRNATTCSISFPTTNLVGYRLRYTDDLTLPFANWKIGPALVGNGGTQILEDTEPDTARFYLIEAYY